MGAGAEAGRGPSSKRAWRGMKKKARRGMGKGRFFLQRSENHPAVNGRDNPHEKKNLPRAHPVEN